MRTPLSDGILSGHDSLGSPGAHFGIIVIFWRGSATAFTKVHDMMRKLWLYLLATSALSIMSYAEISAQVYPSRPVTIVVPYGVGGITDFLARVLAEEMGRRWGQQVLVETRPGLAGMTAVAKAPADGYTLMVTSNGHTVAGLVTKDPPFHPVNDFAGITRLGSSPMFLVVHPDFPAKTLKEALDLARAQPGKLNFSSPGLASTTFIAAVQLRKAAGINIVHVPFRSAVDSMTAILRGDVQYYFAPVNMARDQSASGRVRVIAAATAERDPNLPDVPTFTEAGLPFVYDSWYGLIAPAGVPPRILEKISVDWADIVKTADMQTKLRRQFLVAQSDTPAAMDKIIRDETTRLATAFKEAGVIE
ncbi:MAG: Bug family tripartite tricarboxylate transporter substrate binding protein [Xanthobacteraceae bacterium]